MLVLGLTCFALSSVIKGVQTARRVWGTSVAGFCPGLFSVNGYDAANSGPKIAKSPLDVKLTMVSIKVVTWSYMSAVLGAIITEDKKGLLPSLNFAMNGHHATTCLLESYFLRHRPCERINCTFSERRALDQHGE